MTTDRVHVCPVADEHDTDGLGCWCAPTYNLVCDECDAEDHRGAAQGHLPAQPSHPGCWKCQNGLIPLTRAEAEATDQPLIIVHNR
jgi:hypothetical protein